MIRIHLMYIVCRRLDRKQAVEAIKKLGLFTTTAAFDVLFLRLDQDRSQYLEWEVLSII